MSAPRDRHRAWAFCNGNQPLRRFQCIAVPLPEPSADCVAPTVCPLIGPYWTAARCVVKLRACREAQADLVAPVIDPGDGQFSMVCKELKAKHSPGEKVEAPPLAHFRSQTKRRVRRRLALDGQAPFRPWQILTNSGIFLLPVDRQRRLALSFRFRRFYHPLPEAVTNHHEH
jgi:hypothetical protein